MKYATPFKTFSDFKLLLYFSPNFTREQSSQPKSWCRGFTLIEILVVIGIIGLLTAIMTVSFSEVRKQSRDKSRMVGLKQLELALELYREANGQYPAAGCGAGSGWASEGTGNGGVCEEYIDGLAPTYIPKLPHDPNLGTWGYGYRVVGNSNYKVTIFRGAETLVITSNDDDFARCPSYDSGGAGGECSSAACSPSHSAFSTTYAVYSPGGSCF